MRGSGEAPAATASRSDPALRRTPRSGRASRPARAAARCARCPRSRRGRQRRARPACRRPRAPAQAPARPPRSRRSRCSASAAPPTPRQCGSISAHLAGRQAPQTRHLVLAASPLELVEPPSSLVVARDDQLPAALVLDPLALAELVHLAGALDAQASLERAGHVVDAGVDHAAVAAGLAAGDGRPALEHGQRRARAAAASARGRPPARGSRRRRRPGRTPPGPPASQPACFWGTPLASSSRSESTISRTISSKLVRGSQPSFSRALDGSPIRCSTSAGRR